MRKKKDRVPTRHHIIPRSRMGSDNDQNIMMVRGDLHEKYHTLFENMLPDEIIKYLVEVFWKHQWHWVDVAKMKDIEKKIRGKT